MYLLSVFPHLAIIKNYKFPLMFVIIAFLAIGNFMGARNYFLNTNQQQSVQRPTPPQEKVLSVRTTIAEPTVVPTAEATSAPIHRPVSFGVVVDDYANKTGELSSLQSKVGKRFSTVSIFKQFGLPTNNLLPLDDLAYIKSQGAKLMIAWEPWDPREGMQQSKDYLKEIIDGKQDDYIKSFASGIKAYGNPVILRFGHEMNSTWYPWGSRPAEYVQAYRRIVTILRNEGVTNVTFMWSVNATPLDGISGYYPGNEYVDNIGIDGYNFGTSQPSSTWVSFSQIFGPAYSLLHGAYNKPISISEVASTEVGGDKHLWIQNMFNTLSQNMTGINEIVWFSLNKETDWRIDSSQASLSAFAQSI